MASLVPSPLSLTSSSLVPSRLPLASSLLGGASTASFVAVNSLHVADELAVYHLSLIANVVNLFVDILVFVCCFK